MLNIFETLIYSIILLSCVLSRSSSAQIRHKSHHSNSSLIGQQCPPWSFYDKNSRKCNCFEYDFKCRDDGTYLKAGFCATYDNNTGIISYTLCPYFQSSGFNMTRLSYHYWYIQLPENVSELNDFLCGRMNRKGKVCSKCKDGFGPAVMSIGFEIHCSRCIGALYGIPLYLFLELCPVTIFYLILLIFQINITSAPMTGYIMYSQLLVLITDRLFSGDMTVLTGVIYSLNEPYIIVSKVILSIYEIWNLRFFRYLMPSFCISATLKPIHIAFLGYVSVFYPLCLIFLTWVCIELHDHNFRAIVWLWKPFHRCLVHLRRGWNTKSDIIDVFASFFLLSFTKGLYQVVLLMTDHEIHTQKGMQLGRDGHVINVDFNVTYGSTEHLMFAIPAIIISCIFNILPALLILLYPVRLFRAFLSKCKLDGIVLYTFVEKFYSCYRNGLNGGKDMRSFAGLYFVLRVILIFSKGVGVLFKISDFDPFFIRNIIFTVVTIFICLCLPYKHMYMNILDALLLAHLGISCHLLSVYRAFSIQANFVFTCSVMISLPFVGFILLILVRCLKKIMKTHAFKLLTNKCKRLPMLSSTKCECPLIEPTVAEISYGTIHY